METVRTTLPRLTRLIVLLVLVPAFDSEASTEESGPASAVVEAFHAALQRGEGKAAVELLAPDAVILESGVAQTREEYEKHHLAEDIAFLQAVTSTSSTPTVHIEGNTAWVSSTSRVAGIFNGRKVNSAGAELVVLTNSASGWRIRAIHWSSRKAK
jgi:ketosteroid isomerase-like protein